MLILVHPGSTCGSADFNIGFNQAHRARRELITELEQWEGPLLVVDGVLSDELSNFEALNAAITNAMERAEIGGHFARRVNGPDPDQVDVVRTIVDRMASASRPPEFVVTGAWYYPEDGSGCVGSVVDVLREMGLTAKLSAAAFCLEPGENDSPSPGSLHKGPKP